MRHIPRLLIVTLVILATVGTALHAQRNCGCSILDPLGWRLEYSKLTTLTVSAIGEPSFQFPGKRGTVAMLTKHWEGTPNGSLLITLRLATTKTPIFHLRQGADACANPPAARPWFATTRWEWDDGDGTADWNRWWSQYVFMPLSTIPGSPVQTVTLTVPLMPDMWINVNGQLGTSSDEAEAHFWRVVTQGGRLGLVFGGGCSYGHGLYVTGGGATMTVLNYDVL